MLRIEALAVLQQGIARQTDIVLRNAVGPGIDTVVVAGVDPGDGLRRNRAVVVAQHQVERLHVAAKPGVIGGAGTFQLVVLQRHRRLQVHRAVADVELVDGVHRAGITHRQAQGILVVDAEGAGVVVPHHGARLRRQQLHRKGQGMAGAGGIAFVFNAAEAETLQHGVTPTLVKRGVIRVQHMLECLAGRLHVVGSGMLGHLQADHIDILHQPGSARRRSPGPGLGRCRRGTRRAAADAERCRCTRLPKTPAAVPSPDSFLWSPDLPCTGFAVIGHTASEAVLRNCCPRQSLIQAFENTVLRSVTHPPQLAYN